MKERQRGVETCSAKEQPSFLTHLRCLLSLCQSGTVCVCLCARMCACVRLCFGVLSTHAVFGWQLAVVQDSTHCGVCAFHSRALQHFASSPCATCEPPALPRPSVHAGTWSFFQGGCVRVCVRLCLRGLLENVWAAALVGV